MPKGSSKSTAVIQRLLEERRQYESWIARLSNAADATPEHVRARVKADYEARLVAVTEELRIHAESARQAIDQKKHFRAELQKKEALVAEKLAETELRHAVGEYDEAQWSQVHKDVLSELVAVREELQAVEADLVQLEELEALVRSKPHAPQPLQPLQPPRPAQPPPVRVATPPRPQPKVEVREEKTEEKPKVHVDELAFIKSVTEDERTAPSPRRASGAQYQPAIPGATPRPAPAASTPPAPAPQPGAEDEEAAKTLRCKECGKMNLPTEWYCEQCGAELAAV